MSQIDERALATHIKDNLPTPPGGWKSRGSKEWDKKRAAKGLPLATIEPNNPGKGRSWRNAVRGCEQYHDPRTPSFVFKQRALVHLAGGPDAAHAAIRIIRALSCRSAAGRPVIRIARRRRTKMERLNDAAADW